MPSRSTQSLAVIPMGTYEWRCKACENVNPSGAESCSTCGCPASSTSVEIDAYAAKYHAESGKKFQCAKCQHPEFDTGEIRASGGILSSVLEVESEKFAFVSCKRCGYTEFYRGDRNFLRNIFDFGV